MKDLKYQFVIPYSHTKHIDVTAVLSDKIISSNGNGHEKKSAFDNLLPDEELITEKSIHHAFARFYSHYKTLMVATSTGFHILRPEKIVYFEYQKTSKQWMVVLSDHNTHLLRRATVAEDIMGYSALFFRINQQQIINLDYLSSIENKVCTLTVKVKPQNKLQLSRNYYKQLLERMELI